MHPRRINLLLRACMLLCIAGAVVALALALVIPLESPHSDNQPAAVASTAPARSGVRPLSDFELAWGAPLRQSLEDLPASPDRPSAIANADASSSGVSLKLVGTIGQSLALLQSPDGAISVRGVGESASGLEIVAIRTAEVDVRVNGQLATLRKPQDRTAQR